MDSVLILNTNINITTVEEVAKLLQNKDSKTVAVCNANTLVRSYKNKELQDKINSFDIRVPDGFPVAKASSILYKNHQKRVDGYNALQLGFDEKANKHSSKVEIGHFKKANTSVKRKIVEFAISIGLPTLCKGMILDKFFFAFGFFFHLFCIGVSTAPGKIQLDLIF